MNYLDPKTELPVITGSLISYFSNKVKLNGGTNLAQGIPGFRPPQKLLQIFSEVLDKDIHQYAPGCGNKYLLEQLEKKYQNRSANSRIFITSGATEAVSLIYTYLQANKGANFNAMSFSPAYESYIHLPKIFGNGFFTYPTDPNVYFDEDDFRKFFIKNKIDVIFIASPGNPYGKTISKEKMNFLIDLCEEFGSYIIIDSVYGELYFNNERPYYPLDRISPSVFYCNSFSKKYSVTGWRVGYFIFHESHFSKISYIHDYIGLSSAAPQQQAIAEFLDTEESKTYITELRSKIIDNLHIGNEMLLKMGFYCPQNDGGYFIWAKLPEPCTDGLRFGLALYEEVRTAVIPGVHFGSEWNNYIRINIAREKEEFVRGINNIIDFAKKR
ncbi:MAG: pyridoxal phosphate-dependent aminotransferase [Bacteroidales bacterium]|nr:pyridoxal phosphate-dependent aminotransferase [Bacteroidales bacterium]